MTRRLLQEGNMMIEEIRKHFTGYKDREKDRMEILEV